MSDTTITGTVLDHVAHAVPDWRDVWDRYAVDFGAEWASGGPGPGFAPAQLRFGNGARIEVLMPCNVEVNDFLDRFLSGNGPGPHHLTFKVPDLTTALDKVERFGLEPIGVDRSDPEWMEAFIHPKRATGVVVQLAEAKVPWSSPPPDGYPTGQRMRKDGTGPLGPASLIRVVHAVADLDVACDLFGGLLDGRVLDEGTGPDRRWVDLGWDGPLGIRLVAPAGRSSNSPLTGWLGGRAGRIHHLDLTADEPAELPGARRVDPTSPAGSLGDHSAGQWEIAPEDNGGLRLMIGPAPSTILE